MYMSYDLTGGDNDIELTNMRSVFSRFTLDKLFPITQDSLDHSAFWDDFRLEVETADPCNGRFIVLWYERFGTG